MSNTEQLKDSPTEGRPGVSVLINSFLFSFIFHLFSVLCGIFAVNLAVRGPSCPRPRLFGVFQVFAHTVYGLLCQREFDGCVRGSEYRRCRACPAGT